MFERLREVTDAATRARPGELAFAARAWMLVPVAEALLATVGVGATLRWLGRLPRAHAMTKQRAVAVPRGRVCVHRAFALHPLGGRCLSRSIVQHALHRLDGVSSVLVVGVRRERAESTSIGLDAHAWVNESADRLDAEDAEGARFSPILILRGDAIGPASVESQ